MFFGDCFNSLTKKPIADVPDPINAIFFILILLNAVDHTDFTRKEVIKEMIEITKQYSRKNWYNGIKVVIA